MSGPQDVTIGSNQDFNIANEEFQITPVDSAITEPVSRDVTAEDNSLDVEMAVPNESGTHDDELVLRMFPETSQDIEMVQPAEVDMFHQADATEIRPADGDLGEVLLGDETTAPVHVAEESVIQVANASTPLKKTSAIKPHRTLGPADTVDLVNTIQTIFEEDATVRDNGVILLDAPHLRTKNGDIKLPHAKYNFEATSQRVMIPTKLAGAGLVVIKHEQAVLKDQVPKFLPVRELSEDDMEGIFHDHIEQHGRHSKRFPYFNIDLSDYRVRPEGSFELTCGSPMDKLSYIAGVNTPYGYYSRGISHFGAHVEDWHFASYNILFAGQVKLWVAVKPSSKELFETKIREMFPEIGNCVQFVRHLAINIAPSTLRKWGVEHVFVPQMPGQVVAVSGYTYHWGINTGHNYAEAINFCMEKNWEAPKEFKNCYHGCGIADEMIPLPKPIWEDGDLETKKERAILRDQTFRKEWEAQSERIASMQDIPSASKKSKPRKQRESISRPQSEAIRSLPAQDSPPTPSRTDPLILASTNRPQRPSQSSTLQDSIEVSAAAQRLNGRDYRRRTTMSRQAYRDLSSSPSEPSESTDDEKRVKRVRHMKPTHSRHPSGILDSLSQPDTSAVATQINALRNTVLSFLIDQKKAASEATSKQEQLMRLHVDWQIKQTELAQKQAEYALKAMESQQRTEHLTMMMLQRLESQRLVPKSSSVTDAIDHARGHSRSSHSTGGSTVATGMPSQGKHSKHRQRLSRQQINLDAALQVHAGVAPPIAPQSVSNSAAAESLITDIPHTEKAFTASNVTSRAPSTMGSSTHATEADVHTSTDSSPNTPQLKSVQSTPLVDDAMPTSPPSSLSEHAPDDDTITLRGKPDSIQESKAGADAKTNESALSEPVSPRSEEGSECATKPKQPTSQKHATAVSVTSASERRSKLKCTPCRERRVPCGKEKPACANCVEDAKPRTCVYPAPKMRGRPGQDFQGKRAASETVPASTQSRNAKRAKTEVDNAEAIPSQVASRRASTVQPSVEGNPGMTRELLGLFPTNEWSLATGQGK